MPRWIANSGFTKNWKKIWKDARTHPGQFKACVPKYWILSITLCWCLGRALGGAACGPGSSALGDGGGRLGGWLAQPAPASPHASQRSGLTLLVLAILSLSHPFRADAQRSPPVSFISSHVPQRSTGAELARRATGEEGIM